MQWLRREPGSEGGIAMKKIEASFSLLSFSIAIAAGGLLAADMPALGFLVATGGSVLTVLAYSAVQRLARQKATDQAA